MDWIFKSDHCESISLHDYDITNIEINEDVTLNFADGFDVCAENPLNDTGRHKHTGKAAVVLKNGEFLSAECPSYEENGEKIPAENISLDELLTLNSEIYSFDFENGVFTLECLIHNAQRTFFKARFKCDKPVFCWNEFTEDAWFQE